VDIVEATATAKSVAIVGFGHKSHPWVAANLQERVGAELLVVDLRKELGDPLREDRVKHGEDGSFPKTITAVYGQPNFAATTMDTFGKIVEASYAQALNIAALFCHSGYHRCDTSCRTLEGGLNAIVLDTGERVFNAQYFPTVHCNGAREVERVLDTALEWANCPWTIMPTITHEKYGMSAVRSRPEAQKAFSEIWDNVRRCEAWMSEEAAQAQHDRDEPEPPARKKRRRRSSPAETEDFIIFIWG
jgi:hypothetical protein